MRRGPQSARLGYFGKLPARGDFIKAADNLALASLLDDWLAEVMNALSADPRWKRRSRRRSGTGWCGPISSSATAC